MIKDVVDLIPFTHQPYLFGDNSVVFVGCEKAVNPSGRLEYFPWRVYIAIDSFFAPIPLPFDVCCTPVVCGKELSIIGGVELGNGINYKLFKYALSDDFCPLEGFEVRATWTGFCFPYESYLVDRQKVFVDGVGLDFGNFFEQIYRIVPLSDRSEQFLVTGVGKDDRLKTGLFNKANGYFYGWILNSKNQHVYKSSIRGDLLVYASQVDASAFDSRKLVFDTWSLMRD